jgi:hypothetical protein
VDKEGNSTRYIYYDETIEWEGNSPIVAEQQGIKTLTTQIHILKTAWKEQQLVRNILPGKCSTQVVWMKSKRESGRVSEEVSELEGK